MGWKWIFIFSIIFAILALWLIKDTPESKAANTGNTKFDISGLIIFIITMLALNIVITQGAEIGWTNWITLVLVAVAIIGAIVFVKVENGKSNALIDFGLFKNAALYRCNRFKFLAECCSRNTCRCKYVCTSKEEDLLRFNPVCCQSVI